MVFQGRLIIQISFEASLYFSKNTILKKEVVIISPTHSSQGANMRTSNKARRNKTINEGANIAGMNQYANNIDDALQIAEKRIVEQAKRYKNNTFASQNGFVAEEVHIGSFNVDSTIKRSSLKAVAEKNGNHGDYRIVKNGKTMAKGEFKHYTTAEKTENAMKGYGDRDLVGPKDQIADVKKVAKKRYLKNKNTRPEVAKEHKVVSKKATDTIKKDGVSSKPKTLKETKKITKKAMGGKVDRKELLPDFESSMKSSLKSGAIEGAKTGAVFGGCTSALSNAVDVANGKKNVKQAVKDFAIDTTLSVADSAVKNAVGSAAKTASLHLAEKVSSSAAKTLFKSSAPVIVAVSTVEVVKDVVRYANGDIDGEEVVKNAAKTTATAAGGWGGAEAGAMAGAAVGGPVGAVVGGIVGGILGSLGVGSLFD